MPEPRRILTLHPNHIPSYGIGHAAYSISKSMANNQFSTLIISSSIDNQLDKTGQKSLIPKHLKRPIYKLIPEEKISKATEQFFLKSLRKDDIAYLWPGCTLNLFQRVKAQGNILLMESINCHQQTCKTILDQESKRLGIAPTHLIDIHHIDDENTKLDLCDFVFSPSPLVTESLLDNNIDKGKIIQSSYGLSRNNLQNDKHNNLNNDQVTALFVGRVGLRKGVHLLLDYWVKANINGKLKIVGNIEPSIQSLIEPYQTRTDIEFIDFVQNLKELYNDADFFILPSLEEGSPLVTYLALAHGLPCLVSPMAGAGIISQEKHGFIIDPHAEKQWISAIQRLATTPQLRKQQSTAVVTLSEQFLWENVGQQRREALQQRLKRI